MIKIRLQFFGGRGGSSAGGKSIAKQAQFAESYGASDSSDHNVDHRNELLDAGFNSNEVDEMFSAIKRYTGTTYTSIRKHQTGERPGDNDIIKQSEDIESFIKYSSKYDSGEIHRGINLKDDAAENIIKQLSQGSMIDMRGTSSWSSDKSIAEEFAGTDEHSTFTKYTSIVFTNSKGTKAGTSVRSLSNFDYEDEVLVSKNTVYSANSITKVTGKHGKPVYYVNVEEHILSD